MVTLQSARSRLTIPASNAALAGLVRQSLIGIFAALLFSVAPAMAQKAPPANADEITGNLTDPEKSQKMDTARTGRRGGYCSISISEDGQLFTSPDSSQLSSQGFGGRPGRAQIATNRRKFRISIDPPFGFTVAPNGGNNGVIFTTYMSGSGATNFTNRPGGNSRRLKRGVTTITADLVADRSGQPFPAGQYRAELVLRCE